MVSSQGTGTRYQSHQHDGTAGGGRRRQTVGPNHHGHREKHAGRTFAKSPCLLACDSNPPQPSPTTHTRTRTHLLPSVAIDRCMRSRFVSHELFFFLSFLVSRTTTQSMWALVLDLKPRLRPPSTTRQRLACQRARRPDLKKFPATHTHTHTPPKTRTPPRPVRVKRGVRSDSIRDPGQQQAARAVSQPRWIPRPLDTKRGSPARGHAVLSGTLLRLSAWVQTFTPTPSSTTDLNMTVANPFLCSCVVRYQQLLWRPP